MLPELLLLVTDVFNNPDLVAAVANFLPDPRPDPPPPPPRPDNAARRSPRLEQARGQPVRYREYGTIRGQVYSLPLYAPSYPGEASYDTIADWFNTDTEDEEDDEDFVEDTEYLEFLDRGGEPRLFQRERERE